jgi:phenylacetate-CoA ligase
VANKKIPMERQQKDNVYYLGWRYHDEDSIDKMIIYLMEEQVKMLTALAAILDRLARYISTGKAPLWKGKFLTIF